MLSSTTCVGLRYGPHGFAFLGSPFTASLRPEARLGALFRQRAAATGLRHFLMPCGCGNVDPLPIGCPFRVRLRSRLTLIRLALIRKP
jgi:hypothetical protein